MTTGVRQALQRLANVAARNENVLARLHGIWGLGQLARQSNKAIAPLLPLLTDRDAEVRAQTAKVLGDAKATKAANALIQLLSDAQERPRFFAAIALGQLKKKDAVPTLLEMARANNNRDKYLRHAAVIGLVGCVLLAVLLPISSVLIGSGVVAIGVLAYVLSAPGRPARPAEN